jgi:hypothetical protein
MDRSQSLANTASGALPMSNTILKSTVTLFPFFYEAFFKTAAMLGLCDSPCQSRRKARTQTALWKNFGDTPIEALAVMVE